VIGVDGLPSCKDAGNVLYPKLSMKLSIRTPPTLKCQEVAEFTKKELERNPPYNAKITVDTSSHGNGWYSSNQTESF
jgi:hypothetical protein